MSMKNSNALLATSFLVAMGMSSDPYMDALRARDSDNPPKPEDAPRKMTPEEIAHSLEMRNKKFAENLERHNATRKALNNSWAEFIIHGMTVVAINEKNAWKVFKKLLAEQGLKLASQPAAAEITNEEEYQAALEEFKSLENAALGSPEAERADMLSLVIHQWEKSKES